MRKIKFVPNLKLHKKQGDGFKLQQFIKNITECSLIFSQRNKIQWVLSVDYWVTDLFFFFSLCKL